MTLIRGFGPIATPAATRLVLGSMPGKASLDAGEYYAHPRNAFWPIVAQLLEVPEGADYAERCRYLKQHGIALWDVLGACERTGSLDSAIRPESMEANDFVGFFADCPGIVAVYFNGATAERAFNRHVNPLLGERGGHLRRVRLPSTSPAHAAMGFAQKLAQWRAIIDEPDARARRVR